MNTQSLPNADVPSNSTTKHLMTGTIRKGHADPAQARIDAIASIRHGLMALMLIAHRDSQRRAQFILPAEQEWCQGLALRAARMLDPDFRIFVAASTADEVVIQFEEREASPKEIARFAISAYESRLMAPLKPAGQL